MHVILHMEDENSPFELVQWFFGVPASVPAERFPCRRTLHVHRKLFCGSLPVSFCTF